MSVGIDFMVEKLFVKARVDGGFELEVPGALVVVEFREGPVRVTRQGLLLPGERNLRHWETLRHVRESSPSRSEVPAPPVSDGVPIRQIVLGATPTVLGFDGGVMVKLQPMADGRQAAFKLGQLCHWVLRQLSVTGRALDEIGLLPEASA